MAGSVDPRRLAAFRRNTDPVVLRAFWKVGRLDRPPLSKVDRDALNAWLDERLELLIDAILSSDMTRGQNGRRHYELGDTALGGVVDGEEVHDPRRREAGHRG